VRVLGALQTFDREVVQPAELEALGDHRVQATDDRILDEAAIFLTERRVSHRTVRSHNRDRDTEHVRGVVDGRDPHRELSDKLVAVDLAVAAFVGPPDVEVDDDGVGRGRM